MFIKFIDETLLNLCFYFSLFNNKQIGRPVVYGLAANGEHGVRSVIKMLQNELELTMALAGCPTLRDITRNHVMINHERPRSLL